MKLTIKRIITLLILAVITVQCNDIGSDFEFDSQTRFRAEVSNLNQNFIEEEDTLNVINLSFIVDELALIEENGNSRDFLESQQVEVSLMTLVADEVPNVQFANFLLEEGSFRGISYRISNAEQDRDLVRGGDAVNINAIFNRTPATVNFGLTFRDTLLFDSVATTDNINDVLEITLQGDVEQLMRNNNGELINPTNPGDGIIVRENFREFFNRLNVRVQAGN